MNLTQKTQTDLDLQVIENASIHFGCALNSAIIALNICYESLWNLPDDRLVAVLQKLHDGNLLIPLFEDHYISATSLNTVQDKLNTNDVKAYDVVGRMFTIDSNGIVALAELENV